MDCGSVSLRYVKAAADYTPSAPSALAVTTLRN